MYKLIVLLTKALMKFHLKTKLESRVKFVHSKKVNSVDTVIEFY